MFEEKWNAYANSWSQPETERRATLAAHVSGDVVYTDPTVRVSGRDAFAAHMAQFQENVPGARFEILDVKGHHNQSLSRWKLVAGDGSEVMLGTSHAMLSDDGKFTSFTGFF